MHSKKIGTVLSVGLIQRFLFRLINPMAVIGVWSIRVNLFFDEADVAAAFHACHSNLRYVVCLRTKAHILVQIVR